MKNITDLRFLIGAFFLIIGLLLAFYSRMQDKGAALNFWTGLVFLAFALVMIISAPKSETPK